MDFTYKGLSWAENLLQKFEQSCTDSALVQYSYKYFDVVGNHIKNALEAVEDEWFDDYSRSTGCQVAKSSEVCAQNQLDEKEAELNLSLAEELNALAQPPPCVGRDQESYLSEAVCNKEGDCTKKPVSISADANHVIIFDSEVEQLNARRAPNLLCERGHGHYLSENLHKLEAEYSKMFDSLLSHMNHVKAFDTSTDYSEDIPYTTESLSVSLAEKAFLTPSEHKSTTSVLSDKLIGMCTLTDTTQHISSHEGNLESNAQDIFLQMPENKDGAETLGNFIVGDLNNEAIEEFEIVEPEDWSHWTDGFNAEVSLIAKLLMRKKTYMDKLKGFIISKLHSSKSNQQAGNHINEKGMGLKELEVAVPSIIDSNGFSEESGLHDFHDYSWELI